MPPKLNLAGLLVMILATCVLGACSQEKSAHPRSVRILSTVTIICDFAQEDHVGYSTRPLSRRVRKSNHTWEEINTYSAYDYEKWGVPLSGSRHFTGRGG